MGTHNLLLCVQTIYHILCHNILILFIIFDIRLGTHSQVRWMLIFSPSNMTHEWLVNQAKWLAIIAPYGPTTL